MSARPRPPGDRAGIDPKHLYIGIEVAESFFVAITYTTAVVYRVTSGHQNALQLILLGTMLELSYFVVQLRPGSWPTSRAGGSA